MCVAEEQQHVASAIDFADALIPRILAIRGISGNVQSSRGSASFRLFRAAQRFHKELRDSSRSISSLAGITFSAPFR